MHSAQAPMNKVGDVLERLLPDKLCHTAGANKQVRVLITDILQRGAVKDEMQLISKATLTQFAEPLLPGEFPVGGWGLGAWHPAVHLLCSPCPCCPD